MSDVHLEPTDPLLNMSLERVESVERAVNHLSRAIMLKLIDLELQPNEVSEGEKEILQRLGGSLVRIADSSGTTARGIAATLGEGANSTPTPTKPTEQPVAPLITDSRQPEDAPTVSQPPLAETATEPVVPIPASVPIIRAETTASNENKDGVSLYSKIITIDQLPKLRPIPEGEEIEIAIVGDDTLRINGENITLKKHELYLFNAFALLRDKIRTGNELKELGFYPEAKSSGTKNTAFYNALKSVTAKINGAAQCEIIKKLGSRRSTKYVVNPRALLTDIRSVQPEPIPAVAQNGVKKN